MPSPRLTDVKGAAEYLGVTERRIRDLVYLRRIPFVKLEGRLMFDFRKLDRWIETNTIEAAS